VGAVPEPVTPAPYASADLDGRLLGDRYRLGPVIASGGMAQVRRGVDEVLGREVAVKILHPHLADDPVLVDRFRREAVAAARLTDPSIVAIYDTVTDGAINAIVMEMVHGITLRQFLDQRGPLAPEDAVDVAAGVAQALQVAHEAGIVHRDIKPANILLCDDRRVKVADFGIARAGDGGDLTQAGTMVGTAKYLAPEQVEGGPVDPRTDIYALGVVLYECLTGRPPFEADTDAATALARLHREPLRPRHVRPSVPRSLDALCMQALSRDPAARPPTAAAFRAMLLGAAPDDATSHGADATTIAPLAAIAAEPEVYARTERRWLIPIALILLVGVALGLAGVLIGRTEAGKQIIDAARQIVTSSNDSGEGDPGPVTITGARAFDPLGDGSEEDALTALAVDGDPDTAWHTEFYDVGTWERKGGVGLVILLDRATELDELEVRSPTNRWAASIHVADEAAPDLPGWGDPVTSLEGIEAGTATFDLRGRRGGAVLIWFTDLGEAPPNALRLHVTDVTVRAR
jgi:tRNA A-37 threonylcarbamoyl transferase component Bud32